MLPGWTEGHRPDGGRMPSQHLHDTQGLVTEVTIALVKNKIVDFALFDVNYIYLTGSNGWFDML